MPQGDLYGSGRLRFLPKRLLNPRRERRNVNRRRHDCGCVTVFDTIGWRSELVDACDFHSALMSRLVTVVAARPGFSSSDD